MAYLALVHVLLLPFKQQAEHHRPQTQQAFNQFATVHLILETAYPIVQILAPTGIDAMRSVPTAKLSLLVLPSQRSRF